MIRKANCSDVEKITELHFLSQVSGILGKLTSRSLKVYFYSPLIADQTILSTVEIDENEEIRGFLALRQYANRESFYLPYKNLILVKELLFLIIKSPQSIFLMFNILKTERRVFQKIKKLPNDFAEIQILIVRKNAQGNGIGSELIERVIKETKETEIIVKTQSIKAVEFYKKHGFVESMKSNVANTTIFVLEYRGGTRNVN
jgi:N-acetylglutamate synthase-like GNAT family acetyltransferase